MRYIVMPMEKKMAKLKRVKAEQREQLKKLGLENFETWEECAERQSRMVRRFKGHQRRPVPNWKRCDPEDCAASQCPDGCWFASRRYRYLMILEAYRLLSTHSGDLSFVSVAHPRWERSQGSLCQANVDAARQWLYRRFTKLGGNVIAVGGFEPSLNVELDGRSYWAGHVHLVVAGATKDAIKRILSIEKRYRATPYARPVDVRDVGNLCRQLGYSLKRFAERRIAYIDEQGRQNRRPLPLNSTEQREFDAWLLSLPVGARTILIGCRLHGSRLHVVKASDTFDDTHELRKGKRSF